MVRVKLSLIYFLILLITISGTNLSAQKKDSLAASQFLKTKKELKNLSEFIRPNETGKSIPGEKNQEKVRYSFSGSSLKFLGAPHNTTFQFPDIVKGDQEKTSINFLKWFSAAFGISSDNVSFKKDRVRNGKYRNIIIFNQFYKDIPVFAGQINFQINNINDGIECVSSDIMLKTEVLDNQLLTIPSEIDSEQAVLQLLENYRNKHHGYNFKVSEPILKIFDPSIIGKKGSIALVWEISINCPDNPLLDSIILIDTNTGMTILKIPLTNNIVYREIYDADNTEDYPGILERQEGDPLSLVADVNTVYNFIGNTYDFYLNEHNRDGIDGSGMPIKATVRFGSPSDFVAGWSRELKWILFGSGMVNGLDAVAHEYTHGVTQFESQLLYCYQSGAINESFSDIWGEFVDQKNNQFNNWEIGEDLPCGTIRDMQYPSLFFQPSKMSDLYQYYDECDKTNDSCGVHINSGIGNKLCYLLTDGDEFNGFIINGMGIDNVADLFYDVQTITLNNRASEYSDLYDALIQSTYNLSWSEADRNNVEAACRAVEIHHGILDITGDNLAPGFWGKISVEVVAPEDGDYYVGVWDVSGYSAPEWDWWPDFNLSSDEVGSNEETLTLAENHKFEFNVKPSSAEETFQFCLYIKDEDGFYLLADVFEKTIYASSPSLNAFNLEYFIDNDPGFGHGNKVLVNSSEDVTKNMSIALGIGQGFHSLNFRLKDNFGRWSQTERTIFYNYVFPAEPEITLVEYYIDNDPGFGKGIKPSIVPSPNISKSFHVAITGITDGFHTLFIRSRDLNGKWSQTDAMPFYKIQLNPDVKIYKIEYFVDTDPGFGNGSIISVTPSESINRTFNLNLTNVANGFHRLYIRVHDGYKRWSILESVPFYRIESKTSPKVEEFEYFFDNDPGFGLGNTVQVSPSLDNITSSFNASLTGLSEGDHKFYLRAKDSDNKWSLAYYQTVTVSITTDLKSTDSDDDYILYPNPTSGIVNLLLKHQIEEGMYVEVIDITGQKVFSEEIAKGYDKSLFEIDLTGHPKGLYFVKLRLINNVITKKIVIQ